MDLNALKSAPRLLITASLQPVLGTRFQPTGFPDLGAAKYSTADGRDMLLVESAQSMANRLETVCWDEANDKPIEELTGLPYVESTLPDGTKTNSILEAHRLNSPYLVNADGFDAIKSEIGFVENKPFDRQKLVSALFRYDPCSLLHGIFLEKIGGVVRLPRALSAFIEADNVNVAASGGVKVDQVQPSTSADNTPYGKAADGYGNVPFHRDEYTGNIKAFFNLDLSLIQGFRLPDEAKEFLVTLALFKIDRFLATGLRLRTACDLVETDRQLVRDIPGFRLPESGQITQKLVSHFASETLQPFFANPRVTPLKYSEGKAAARKKGKAKDTVSEQSNEASATAS
jgi:CRISPR-associated protein Csb1